jgi:hypothetical protein
VDKEATRLSLLSERPIDAKKTKEFWSSIGSETGAESFLADYRANAECKLNSLWALEGPTEEDNKLHADAELEALLSVPFDVQLGKLAVMGMLRPILDDYALGRMRRAFLEKYAYVFLEGLEMEHLVPDPDGPIGLDDLAPDLCKELSSGWRPPSDAPESSPSNGGGGGGEEPRFAIHMVAYGTDEYSTARVERAREMYRMWNEHKSNRARFEEALYKRGHLWLEEDVFRIHRRGTKKKDKKDKK